MLQVPGYTSEPAVVGSMCPLGGCATTPLTVQGVSYWCCPGATPSLILGNSAVCIGGGSQVRLTEVVVVRCTFICRKTMG